MPFKTKRHKVSAASRRYVFTNGKVSFAGTSESMSNKSVGVSFSSKVSNDDYDLGENKLLKSEIVKIGIISILIIGFQIGLRFAPLNVWLQTLH
jgi:hypothetical protein